MRKLLTASTIAALTLTLTACGEDKDDNAPQAVSYPSMIEWYDAMDAETSPIRCAHREAVVEPRIPEAKYQVTCTENNGAEANLLIFDPPNKMNQRIEDAKLNDDWNSGDWVILRGPNWTVDCKTKQQCERWKDGFGGELIVSEHAR